MTEPPFPKSRTASTSRLPPPKREKPSKKKRVHHLCDSISFEDMAQITLDAIGMAKRHRKKIALLFVDIDYFKEVNDSFGHAVGDYLLQDVAAKIVSCVRLTDTVSRHGGDEFMILLSEIHEREDAALVAEKLMGEFAGLHIVEGHEIQLTLSVGISVYPDNGIDADTLMRNSDAAMYATKENGRNSYQFYSGY